jgi:chemotaxis regulatin CheY-phosphate phosphatase CheZ
MILRVSNSQKLKKKEYKMKISREKYTIKDELKDIQSAINVALDIHSIYLKEYTEESTKEEFDWIKIKSIKHNLNELEDKIKELNEKWDDLYFNSDIHDEIIEREEIEDVYPSKSNIFFFDNDAMFDTDFSDYEVWKLEELYNDDGSY